MKLGDSELDVWADHSYSKRQRVCSSPVYLAPEVHEGHGCFKSAVWSLGISIVEMAEGKHPYADYSSSMVMYRVLNEPPPALTSSGWSSDLIGFVKRCLVKDVEERASVDELLKASFSVLRYD